MTTCTTSLRDAAAATAGRAWAKRKQAAREAAPPRPTYYGSAAVAESLQASMRAQAKAQVMLWTARLNKAHDTAVACGAKFHLIIDDGHIVNHLWMGVNTVFRWTKVVASTFDLSNEAHDVYACCQQLTAMLFLCGLHGAFVKVAWYDDRIRCEILRDEHCPVDLTSTPQ